MTSFDFGKPILILAPHLVRPTRNGADILVERSARWLSMSSPEVTVIGARETVIYRRGIAESVGGGAGMRSRSTAAARTLALRSHYYRERFLTPSFRTRASAAIAAKTWGGIICSYLTTVELTKDTVVPVAVWTHNDEVKWFEDLSGPSTRPAERRVAGQSLAYLHRHGTELAEDVVIMHVTQADAQGFDRALGTPTSIVVPIGTDTDVPKAEALEPGTEPPTLLFVGSLSVQMNADALRHFATAFEPHIRSAHPGTSITVAGSNPSKPIRTLCSDNEWTLVADPSDSELDKVFLGTTFTILPFAYATGAKLKLLSSLAHAVPFLATEAVEAGEELSVAPSVRSSEPQAWVGALKTVGSNGITTEERASLAEASARYSWERVVLSMVHQLQSA